MRWKKSTDKPTASGKYFIKDTGYGMGMLEFRTDTENWYWHPPTDPVGETYHFEWLDESLPASAEQEAEMLYPYGEGKNIGLPFVTVNGITEVQRSAHINAARMYIGEIERLRAERDRIMEDMHTLAKMQSESMGWVVGLKKRLQSEKPELYYQGELMDFFMGELWQFTTNLEGVHIGSNDRTKDEVMWWVFEQTKEVMEFLNYAGWCNSFYNEGKTWQEFVDWQLDELNSKKADPRRKEFIRKFISKFNVVLNK